jgi:predicted O-methyltransferase YrrM
MGSVPISLVRDLARSLDLRRAIESGTYLGEGTRRLADFFPSVVSIELAPDLHSAAAESLRDRANVQLVLGDSREVLER